MSQLLLMLRISSESDIGATLAAAVMTYADAARMNTVAPSGMCIVGHDAVGNAFGNATYLDFVA